MAPGSDFSMVQLTTEGAAFAGSHPLNVSNGRWAYSFPPSSQVRVANYEWDLWLIHQVTPQGLPLFELVTRIPLDVPTAAKPEPAAEPAIETPKETI